MKASRTRYCVSLVVCCWGPVAAAQNLAELARRPELEHLFQSAAHAPRLDCQIREIHPMLDWGLRFETGYVATASLSQFDASPHRLNVYLRVTPEGRDPVYFSTSGEVPRALAAKFDAEVRGGVAVGEGTYAVEALMEDDQGRACAGQWKAQARLSGVERELTSAIRPGEVREIGAGNWATADVARGHVERLTLIVHAAPLNPNFSKIEESTIAVLDDALAALLQQLPAKSVRVVVASQAKQAVLLDEDSFTAAHIGEVRSAIEQAQLGTVDYGVMLNSAKTDFWSGLAVKDASEPQPSTAVIFLGPRTDVPGPVDREPTPAATTHWYYVQYNPAGFVGRGAGGRGMAGGARSLGMGNSSSPPALEPLPPPGPIQPGDNLERMIHRLNGVTFAVRTPHDLAEAIHRMAGEIPTVQGSAAAAVPQATPDAAQMTAAPLQLKDPGEDIDPVEALAHLRDHVLDHAVIVPNHTCVENVQRDRFEPVAGRATKQCDDLLAARKRSNDRLRLDVTDWLRLDVGVADGREIFSWAGAAKFEEGEIDRLITQGAFSTGPFASLLGGLFESRDPHFVLDGETTLDSRRALQYSFRVAQDESAYRVKAANDWVVTGYTGTLLVDPSTSDLLRLTVRTDELPRSTGQCETDATLDYKMTSVGETEYLLPYATRQRFIGVDGAEAENSVTFGACREFRGQSSIVFGAKSAGAQLRDLPAQAPALPAGLALTIELMTPLTFGQAAAGDRIEGKLMEELRDPATKQALVPAGAAVSGRLTRVELKHGSPSTYTVALRWESLIAESREIPLNLKPDRKLANLKAGAAGVLLHRGSEIELPQRGEESDALYHFDGQRAGVERGLHTQWITTNDR